MVNAAWSESACKSCDLGVNSKKLFGLGMWRVVSSRHAKQNSLAAIASGNHPIPFRTRK
jgi:hypothetical protein